MYILNKIWFFFGLITIILIVCSMMTADPGSMFNKELLMIAIYFAAAYWTWMIINLMNSQRFPSFHKRAWLMIMILVPFFGALLFQLTQGRKRKFAH
jgi:hypothetical protein